MQSKIPVKRAMPIVRLFVSSTFSDLKHERNALHAQVWPELERYCQQRGFTFQAIDLRWGVPAEAGLDHRTMRICFEELRRSQETSPEPNFLILLGNRYGWRPLPEVITVEEFEKLQQAAQQIQTEPPNPTRKPTASQVELLTKAVTVLKHWYLRDGNAKPFGDETLLGEYVLRTRKTLFGGVDYGKQPDADGKLRDTAAWVDVQFVLWSIVNRAFPAADLAGRFQTLHETSPGTLPSIARFQASATEQEIWQGALQVANADRHVITAVREVADLGTFPNRPRQGDFIDLNDDGTPDDDARNALADLKAELARRLSSSPIIRSTCQWAIDQDNNPTGDITTSHLDDFCREILDRFKSIIIEQINAYWGCDLSAVDATLAQVRGSQQELDLECADHLRIAGERAPKKTFVGRESELQRIRDYLHSETNQPFVVHGPSGSGKTALLGKIIQDVMPSRSADGTRAKSGLIVLTRFIGTTPESSNLRSLLSSLCRELRQDFEMPAPLPTELNELIEEFYSQLGKATAARPVFVFLDALDQLDAADHGRSVFWIRSQLSSTRDDSCHSRMVVSCLSPSDEFPEESEACEPFRELKLRVLLNNHELGALDENEARKLFARWLRASTRDLTGTQQKMISRAIRKTFACRQPLFLKLLFEEARRWRSFDAPSAIPESLARLLDELFIRLEKPTEHGELMGIALSCLVSARYGLSEGELLEILYTDPEYKVLLADNNKRNGHELPPDSNRIPIAPWTRVRSDLAPYLSDRAAPGTAVMHFYHRQVEQAVQKRYLRTPDQQTRRHRQLADYFDGRWNRPDAHALMELPHLRLLCQDHDDLLRLLTDLPFPTRKTHAGYVSDLVWDYDNLRARVGQETRGSLAPWYYFIRGNASFLGEHPVCFLQQAFNEPVQSPVSQSAQHLWVLASGTREQSASALPSVVPNTFLEWLNRPAEWQPPACLMTLHGHSSDVNCVALSGDGSTVVSGSRDETVKVWDARTGECRATLQGHAHGVTSVVVSGNGSTIVSGSGDQTAKVWDARTGECRATLQGHTDHVTSVALSGDGSTVVSGSWDRTVKVWDARTGECRATLQGDTDAIESVTLSVDGSTVVSGSCDKTVKVWDTRTGECRVTLRGHRERVDSVVISVDRSMVVSGSWDNTVSVWDARTGQSRATFMGHTDWVHSVALSDDRSTVVSGSRDKTVKVWDARTGECRATFLGHMGVIESVAISRDGSTIVSGSRDHTVKVWDARTSECRATLQGHAYWVNSVALSENGTTVVSGSFDETVKVWDARTTACRATLLGHTSDIDTVALSGDGSTVASGSWDETVKVWNARTGACRATLLGHTNTVSTVTLSVDGSTLVSGSQDQTVKVWDTRTGACRATLLGHTDEIYYVALSVDGSTVVSRSGEGLKVWDARTGACRATLLGHTDHVTSVALSGDGSTVVSGSWDRTVKVWDARTGECRATLHEHTDAIDSVGLSGDGSTVVSGSCDKTVKVWDARTGANRATYPQASPEARAMWQFAGAWNDAARCDIVEGSLRIPDPDGAPLIHFGPFRQAYGPLMDDKFLAFNAKGEAFWFQIRRRKRSMPCGSSRDCAEVLIPQSPSEDLA